MTRCDNLKCGGIGPTRIKASEKSENSQRLEQGWQSRWEGSQARTGFCLYCVILCQNATMMFREDGVDGSSAAQSPASAPSCLRSFDHFSSLLILLSHFTDLYRYFIFLQINQRGFHRCGISRDSQCDLTQLILESCMNIENRNIHGLYSRFSLVLIRF